MINFYSENLFNKYKWSCIKLWICSYFIKKSLIDNFIFDAVALMAGTVPSLKVTNHNILEKREKFMLRRCVETIGKFWKYLC